MGYCRQEGATGVPCEAPRRLGGGLVGNAEACGAWLDGLSWAWSCGLGVLMVGIIPEVPSGCGCSAPGVRVVAGQGGGHRHEETAPGLGSGS